MALSGVPGADRDPQIPRVEEGPRIGLAGKRRAIWSYLGKRFEPVKTVHEIAPVFLKNPARIEALFSIHFLGLRVQALPLWRLRLAASGRAYTPPVGSLRNPPHRFALAHKDLDRK